MLSGNTTILSLIVMFGLTIKNTTKKDSLIYFDK